jgi:hypothetical protein
VVVGERIVKKAGVERGKVETAGDGLCLAGRQFVEARAQN